jgi:hypothetical protein
LSLKNDVNVPLKSNKFINREKKAGAAVLSHSFIFANFFPSLPQVPIKINSENNFETTYRETV